jgi:hypothetical protein
VSDKETRAFHAVANARNAIVDRSGKVSFLVFTYCGLPKLFETKKEAMAEAKSLSGSRVYRLDEANITITETKLLFRNTE